MRTISRPSLNFDVRNADISMIVLHYTGMQSGEEAIERLCSEESKVSAHYVIDEDGSVYKLVEEKFRAWHAGVSYWRGMRNVNANSIGIEIVNPGHEFGYREFTGRQYKSIIALCQELKQKYSIEDINIVGHSDIAPDRKEDPGELFEWELLAQNGIGLWPGKARGYGGTDLVDLGFEDNSEKAIMAFQRHWRPSVIDGQWDEECDDILNRLLAQVI